MLVFTFMLYHLAGHGGGSLTGPALILVVTFMLYHLGGHGGGELTGPVLMLVFTFMLYLQAILRLIVCRLADANLPGLRGTD